MNKLKKNIIFNLDIKNATKLAALFIIFFLFAMQLVGGNANF